ncbi:S26 family signal peptidase [Bremerella cremea]|uniref:S26 family signal peptidase n=1 Tax=Bremerella cremea TaxID=1031537 RepID=UPI0031F14703
MRLGPLLILLIFTASMAAFAIATATPAPKYRVASGSMAPTLLGPHYHQHCQSCQAESVLDGGNLPELTTCPNCGFQANVVDTSQIHRGSELVWEPITLDELRRWDIVLLQNPDDANDWQVKRVAFLPGESPRIEAGELYRGTRLIRKSPQEREAVKQLVYDQSYESPEYPRFLSQRATSSGWNVRRGSIGFAPISHQPDSDDDWLIYHHQRCLPPPSPIGNDAPPLDSYAYNHNVSRELFPANDLWLEWTFGHWMADRLILKMPQGDDFTTITIDSQARTVTAHSWRQTVELPLDVDSLEKRTIRAGRCDGQWFVEISDPGKQRFFPLGAAVEPIGSEPFALKIEGGQAVLRETKIFRDIVWLGAPRSELDWSLGRELTEHEIFVLGDNVPISADSRGKLGAVDARKSLRGKVLRVLAD